MPKMICFLYETRTGTKCHLLILENFPLLGKPFPFARLYDYQFPTDCDFQKSDAVKDLPNNIKRQMCDDFHSIIYIHEPIRYMKPNHYTPTININEYGFRGPEITKQKPDDTFRIFMVGGSTTFGTGSTSDQTSIPGFLHTKLNSANLPFSVEVINAGVSGAASYEESRLIKERIVQFEPDLFIIYDGWNDAAKKIILDNGTHVQYGSEEPKKKIVFNQIKIPEGPLYPPGTERQVYKISKLNEAIFKSLEDDSDYFSNLGSNMYRFTQILDSSHKIITFNLKSLQVIDSFQDDFNTSFVGLAKAKKVERGENPQKVTLWLERWKEICNLGKEEGFEVIITVQPIVGSSNRTLSDSEAKWYLIKDNYKILNKLESYANALPNLDQDCAKTSDMRNIFDGNDSPIYTDEVHMTDFGNEIVAQNLFEITLPIIFHNNSITIEN